MEKQNLDLTLRRIEEKVVELSKTSKKDETISIYFTHLHESEDIRNVNCTLSTFVSTFFSSTVVDGFSNDDTLLVENETISFTVSSIDFLWWNWNTRRKNKFQRIIDTQNPNGKAETQSETPATEEPVTNNKDAVYSIAIADLTEEGLTHIDFYEGKKTDCMAWLNTQVVRHYDIKEQSVMVFDLHYSSEHNDDISKWFTIEELVGMGVAVLK